METRTTFGFYRTAAGAEIDLVVDEGGGELWAVEVKRGSAPKVSRGFHSACGDLNPVRRIVVHPGRGRFGLGNGVEAVPLRALCKELG